MSSGTEDKSKSELNDFIKSIPTPKFYDLINNSLNNIKHSYVSSTVKDIKTNITEPLTSSNEMLQKGAQDVYKRGENVTIVQRKANSFIAGGQERGGG